MRYTYDEEKQPASSKKEAGGEIEKRRKIRGRTLQEYKLRELKKRSKHIR